MKRIHFAAPVRKQRVFLAGAVLLALNVPPPAQADAAQPVFGFYDLKTHVFTPAAPRPAATTAAPIVRKGKLTIQVAVKLDAIPAGQQVLAYPSAYLYDTNYQNAVGSSGPMKRSGSNATVSFTFPYVFTAQAATDKITVSVQIVTQAPPYYPSTMLTKQVPLPANGASTVVVFPGAL
jgi:hypothetical protein